MQIYCDVLAVFDIKEVRFVGLCSWFSSKKESKQGSKQERMDLLSYGVERFIDVAAALVLRAGLKFVDRYFRNVSAAAGTGDSGVSVTLVGDPDAEGGTLFVVETGSEPSDMSMEGVWPLDGDRSGGPSGGVAAEVEVPMVYETGSGTSSGTGSSIVREDGSCRSPSGVQPNGCAVDVLGGGDLVLDFTEAE